MDDVLSIIFMVIVFVISLVPSSKGKKKNKDKKKTVFDAGSAPDGAKLPNAAFAEEKKKPAQKKRPMSLAEERQAQEARRAAQGRPVAGPGMLFQSVSQSEFGRAGEGVDPCHVGGSLDGEPSAVYDSPIYLPKEREDLRRQVLSGVVMSEILTRPCMRRRR